MQPLTDFSANVTTEALRKASLISTNMEEFLGQMLAVI